MSDIEPNERWAMTAARLIASTTTENAGIRHERSMAYFAIIMAEWCRALPEPGPYVEKIMNPKDTGAVST